MILAEYEQIEARARYGANDIRPGLTGWAQINGRDAVTVEEKARLDQAGRKGASHGRVNPQASVSENLTHVNTFRKCLRTSAGESRGYFDRCG